MFRLLKLRPPHGWAAVAWELAIVTLGVLIALGAQQWADNRARQDKMKVSMGAVRDELQEHYGYAVEYRVVYPCLKAQVELLRDRVLKSGATLTPAPLYDDENFRFVLREPSKIYPTDAWEAAVNDGTTQRLGPSARRALAGHYGQLPEVRDINMANNATEEALVVLTHPLPLDASVRYSIVRDIEGLNGQMEYMDYLNGQIIDYVQTVRMLPSAEEARAVVERYGTYHFCKAHGYPTRSFKDAMVGVPN